MFSTALPALSLITAMLLWSSSFVALKFAFEHYDPMWVIFGRMLVASICFLLVWRWVARFEYRKGDLKWLALMVICEPCLYFVFEANALVYTSASQAGMITALAPVLVGVGALLALKESVATKTWAGYLIAIIGAVWLSVSAKETDMAPNPLLGNFLELCAMLCATGYTLCLKHLSQRYSTWFLTALQGLCGSVFFFPLLFLPSTETPVAWNSAGVMAIIYLGTLINIGAYGLFNLGVSKIKASQASAYINLIPVFTLVLAFFLLGERYSVAELMACVLVIGGVLISQMPERKRDKWDPQSLVQE
jgi:drug/metabolite transporter (DMT)-like permease